MLDVASAVAAVRRTNPPAPTLADIEALAAEERRIHPAPLHYREVDCALNALRSTLTAHRRSEVAAREVGLAAEAAHAAAACSRALEAAGPVFQARLNAAKDARDREDARLRECARQSSASFLRGGPGVASRDAGLDDAIRIARLRLDAIRERLGEGNESDFAARLDDLEAAHRGLAAAVSVARRESRLRIAADRAEAAAIAVTATAA